MKSSNSTHSGHSYTIHGETYNLPTNWKEKIISTKTIVGNIESYPAHTSGRQRAKNEIKLLKNGHIQVIREEKAQLKDLVPKPIFLSFLEDHVQKELLRLNCPHEGPDFKRLQVYREAFEWLIEAFRSYKPILQLIKEEYEKLFFYYETQIKKLKPVENYLYTICGIYEKKRQKHLLNVSQGRLRAEQKRNDLQERVNMMKNDTQVLEVEIKELKNTLSIQHEDYIAQVDARKLLNVDIVSLRSQLEDLTLIQKAYQPDSDERADNVIMSLARAKAAWDEVRENLLQLEEKYKNFVPRRQYHKAKAHFVALTAEAEKLHKELKEYRLEKETLTEAIKGLQYERDFFYLKMCEAQQTAKMENRIDLNRIIEMMIRMTATPNITRQEIFETIQKEMKKDTLEVLHIEDGTDTKEPEERCTLSVLNPTIAQLAEFVEAMLGVKLHSIFKPSCLEL